MQLRRTASGLLVPSLLGLTKRAVAFGPASPGSMFGRQRSRRSRVRSQATSGGGGGENWPNESLLPGARTVVLDRPLDTMTFGTEPLGHTWSYSNAWLNGGDGQLPEEGTVGVVTDANAPVSPDFVRWFMPEGWNGGSSPGRAVCDGNWNVAYANVYTAAYVRWSLPWTNHSSGVNKIWYIGEFSAGGVPGQFLTNRRNDFTDAVLQYGQGGQEVCPVPFDSQRNCPSPGCTAGGTKPAESFIAQTDNDDGEWHLVEYIMNGSTGGVANGRLRCWLDNILQFDLQDCRFAPSGNAAFYGLDLDPVWGGGEADEKAQDDTLDMSHVRWTGSNG